MTGDAGAKGVTGQKGETGARGPTGAQVCTLLCSLVYLIMHSLDQSISDILHLHTYIYYIVAT